MRRWEKWRIFIRTTRRSRPRAAGTFSQAQGFVTLSVSSVELCPDGGVVRGAFDFAQCHVGLKRAAALGERGGGKDMVYAPAEIPLESVSEIIPIRVLDPVGVELAKYVCEAPANRLLVCGTGIDVEIDIVHATVRVVYVDRFGRDI